MNIKRAIEMCYTTMSPENFKVTIEKMKRKADHGLFPGYGSLEIENIALDISGEKKIETSDDGVKIKIAAINQEIDAALNALEDENNAEEEMAQEEILSKLEILPLDEEVIFRGHSKILFESLKKEYGAI